jgi:hypothetical protein
LSADPASLDALRDIVVPPPVSWWPLAPGWWILLVAIGLIAALLGRRALLCRRANAYRRAALAQLREASSPADVNTILKRTALAAFPRAGVARLAGPAWSKWLRETGGEDLDGEVADALAMSSFRRGGRVDLAAVKAFAGRWIRRHRRRP